MDLGNKLFPENKKSSRLAGLRKALGLKEAKQPTTREKILGMVSSNLKISTEANTRLIEIRFDSADPKFAADFVNTLASEFVQQNIDAHWKPTQQTGEWLTQQLDDIRTKLEQSEDKLQSYAQESGLLITGEKDNVAEEKLRQLQEELSKAQADRVAKQSKYELASTVAPESLPEVLDDATLNDYQVKLTDLRRQLAEITSTLTPAHPEVKKVQAQVTALESALERERANVIQRIRNEYEAAQLREHLLTGNYATQARLMSGQAVNVSHYNTLKHEVDTNRQLYETMLNNVQEARMTSTLRASNIRIVDTAEPPTAPYKPSFLFNSAIGLLAGAFFGIAFVVVQDRIDGTIKGPGDATVYLDVPELGAIPSAAAAKSQLFAYYQNGKTLEAKKLKSENTTPSRVELITSDSDASFLADSFRATIASILYSGENQDRPRVIVITSASPGEGKTTVASNLALALSEIDQSFPSQPVLLIDADLRRPRIHEIFGVSNDWGLADLLAGKTPPIGCEGMVYKTAFKNLCLLPSGSMTTNISGLLYSPRVLAHLIRMREEFHTVIIDTPPMLHMPEARILGRLADGVILVVRSTETMRHAAVAAKQRLAGDGTRILGTILNQWDPRKTDNYSSSYWGKSY